MKPHKIIEQAFKDEFGEDWGNELRDFEHGFSDYYDCSIKAIQQALNIAAVINRRELLIAFLNWYDNTVQNYSLDETSEEIVDDWIKSNL